MRPHWRARPGGRCHTASERGASLAEFALVMPFLMMILFGIIEFGLIFSRSQAIEAAAREGGRLASLSSTTSADVSSRVEATLSGMTFETTPQVSVIPSSGCAGREGEAVTVIVSVMHRMAIPFVFDRDVTLTGRAVFRCEA